MNVEIHRDVWNFAIIDENLVIYLKLKLTKINKNKKTSVVTSIYCIVNLSKVAQ